MRHRTFIAALCGRIAGAARPLPACRVMRRLAHVVGTRSRTMVLRDCAGLSFPGGVGTRIARARAFGGDPVPHVAHAIGVLAYAGDSARSIRIALTDASAHARADAAHERYRPHRSARSVPAAGESRRSYGSRACHGREASPHASPSATVSLALQDRAAPSSWKRTPPPMTLPPGELFRVTEL